MHSAMVYEHGLVLFSLLIWLMVNDRSLEVGLEAFEEGGHLKDLVLRTDTQSCSWFICWFIFFFAFVSIYGLDLA